MNVKDLLYNVDKIYYSNTFPKSREMLLRLSDYGRIHLEKLLRQLVIILIRCTMKLAIYCF